jgi:hypothetical protein
MPSVRSGAGPAPRLSSPNFFFEKDRTMDDWMIDGGEIVLEPEGGWTFEGFDGVLEVAAPDRGMSAQNGPVVLEEDLQAAARGLLGMAYKADGFADTPGAVISATIAVTASTLSRAVRCGDRPIATAATTGTFSVGCAPSFKAASPPVPDPQAALHRGRWKVRKPGQSAAEAD